jgi:tyrosine-specific transport protein
MVRCELNLRSKANFSLKEVGLFFDCKVCASIGDLALKTLSFALMAAYIFGNSSTIDSFSHNSISFINIAIVMSIVLVVIFLTTSEVIMKINKYAFIILFGFIVIGVICLALSAQIKSWPPIKTNSIGAKTFGMVLPIVFTSFGFQGSLHSLTNLANNNRNIIKKACLFGSIIPAFVYILWTTCVLTIIFNHAPAKFEQMLIKPIEVGELIKILGSIINISVVQHTVWIISFLAIFTSIIGVGISLLDILRKNITNKLLAILTMIIPTTIIAILVPNAFIKVLNFAGIILAIIAIIIPVFLSIKTKNLNKTRMIILLSIGITIIAFGIYDTILLK